MAPRFLLGVVMICLLVGGPVVSKDHPQTLAIKAAATDFDLPGIYGKTHRPSDSAAAKVLAIVLTGNHGPTAQLCEERMKEPAANYRDRGIGLATIRPNDPKAVRLEDSLTPTSATRSRK